MVRAGWTVCGALAVALVGGQVARADEAEEAGAKVVAGLRAGFDERLACDVLLGIYMGPRSLGSVHTTIDRAPEGSGAVYREHVVMEFAFGPTKVRNEHTSLFDAGLSLVRADEVERKELGAERAEVKKTTRRDGDAWVREVSVDGGEPKTFRAEGGDNHDESLMLLVLAVGTKPGKYAFQGLRWPRAAEAGGHEGEGGQDGEGGAAPVWETLTLEVAAAGEVEHRGAKRAAHRISGRKPGEAAIELIVSTAGELLSMAPGDAPIKMVAGTADEVKANLPVPATEKAPGVSDARAAVELYFRVLSAEQPIEALDRILDWSAVFAQASAENPEQLQGFTAEQFADLTKAQLKLGLPTIQPEQVGMLLPMFQVEVAGERATVSMPGKERGFELAKGKDGTWRIVAFPD